MPLKVVPRRGRRFLYLRGTVRGTPIYESTETSDPDRADELRIKREKEIWDQSIHGKQATVTFAEAAGHYLTDAPRTRQTGKLVKKLILHFGMTPLSKIGQESLDGAFSACLRKGLKSSPANKVRSVITPLRAILEHAAVLGWCNRPAFKKPAIPKAQLQFAYPEQVEALVRVAAPHLQPLLTFLVCTGGRPSEAFELDWLNVDLRGARVVVEQKQGDWRYIDLCPRALAALAALPHREGRVFLTQPVIGFDGRVIAKGHPYRSGDVGGGQIKTAFATAARQAGWPGRWRVWTPKGKKQPKRQWVSDLPPYSLRHSWATWHYCVHKDLIGLRNEGGWSDVQMVAHYAKKMPEAYRQEIIDFWNGAPREIEKATG
jgi:integrase